jgi:hypothetical protein
MRWGRIPGGLKQLKSRLGRRLTSLAYDHAMARKRDETVESVQRAQGLSREEAARQLRDWEARKQAHREAERKPQ